MSKASVSKKGQEIETNASVAPATGPATPGKPAFETTPIGLKKLRPPTMDDIAQTLDRIRKAEEQDVWAAGDVAMYCVDTFDEASLEEIAEKLDIDYNTLRTKKWVSKNVPMSIRIDKLSWQHHRHVASCEAEDTKKDWLKRALDGGWSAYKLAHEIKEAKPKEDEPEPDEPEVVDTGTVINNLKHLGGQVTDNWGSWKESGRSAVVAQIKKLVELVTLDSSGKLVLTTVEKPAAAPKEKPAVAESGAPAETPAAVKTSAADIAAAVTPAQSLAGMAATVAK